MTRQRELFEQNQRLEQALKDTAVTVARLRAERNDLADRVYDLEERNRKLYALAVHMSVLIGDHGFADEAGMNASQLTMEGSAA